MAAIHPFHCVLAATLRPARAPVAEPPPAPLAPWLRYLCGRALAAPWVAEAQAPQRAYGDRPPSA